MTGEAVLGKFLPDRRRPSGRLPMVVFLLLVAAGLVTGSASTAISTYLWLTDGVKTTATVVHREFVEPKNRGRGQARVAILVEYPGPDGKLLLAAMVEGSGSSRGIGETMPVVYRLEDPAKIRTGWLGFGFVMSGAALVIALASARAATRELGRWRRR